MLNKSLASLVWGGNINQGLHTSSLTDGCASACRRLLSGSSAAPQMERQAVQRAREAFLSGRTRAVEFRLQQLHALQKMVGEKETDICSALRQDINRVGGSREPARPLVLPTLQVSLPPRVEDVRSSSRASTTRRCWS